SERHRLLLPEAAEVLHDDLVHLPISSSEPSPLRGYLLFLPRYPGLTPRATDLRPSGAGCGSMASRFQAVPRRGRDHYTGPLRSPAPRRSPSTPSTVRSQVNPRAPSRPAAERCSRLTRSATSSRTAPAQASTSSAGRSTPPPCTASRIPATSDAKT